VKLGVIAAREEKGIGDSIWNVMVEIQRFEG
jgi:hypothetical protein